MVLAVSACNTRLNPLHWFGRSHRVQTTAADLAGPAADTRPLVAEVLTMSVEPMPGGAIVRATGLPPTQAWWNGELVAQPIGSDGKLIYDFRLMPPPEPAAVSTDWSRQVTVAAYLSDTKLATITSITVQGAQNARSSRR